MSQSVASLFSSKALINPSGFEHCFLEIFYRNDYETSLHKLQINQRDDGAGYDIEAREVYLYGWISTPENQTSVDLFGAGIHGQLHERSSTFIIEKIDEAELANHMQAAMRRLLATKAAQNSFHTPARLWNYAGSQFNKTDYSFSKLGELAQQHAPEEFTAEATAQKQRIEARILQFRQRSEPK